MRARKKRIKNYILRECPSLPLSLSPPRYVLSRVSLPGNDLEQFRLLPDVSTRLDLRTCRCVRGVHGAFHRVFESRRQHLSRRKNEMTILAWTRGMIQIPGRVIDLSRSSGRSSVDLPRGGAINRKSITGLATRVSTGQFLSILSRNGRGGTRDRSGSSVWDLRAAGRRFRAPRLTRRHQTPPDRGISRNAFARTHSSVRVCFFGDVEFIGARRNRGIAKYSRAARGRPSDRYASSSPSPLSSSLTVSSFVWFGRNVVWNTLARNANVRAARNAILSRVIAPPKYSSRN